MSGICGIVNLDGAPLNRSELERMAQRAAGRDGIDYHCEGPVGMARQPQHSLPHPERAAGSPARASSGPLVVDNRRTVFAVDGRLDNRSDCRPEAAAHPEIQAAGGVNGEPTDAELMLATLLRYPRHGVERLLGDFALALWDGSCRRLLLARDAMGMRTLYYRIEPQRVLFATEVRQILAVEGVPKRLNEQAVAWHLSGMQTPPGNVFYQGIEELKPAEELVIESDRRCRSRIFWRPDPGHRISYRRDEDYAEQLRELMTEAVRCRLRAREPVGISLSGGLDSTAIASVAGWLRERGENVPSMRSYSWAFTKLTQCDERENSRRISERYGMPATDIAVEKLWPLVDYPRHGPHEDDPFSSMYQPGIEAVLEAAAADEVSVMFYGFRGDMMFGGDIADVPGLLKAGRLAAARRELAWIRRLSGYPGWRVARSFLVRPLLDGLLPPVLSGAFGLRRADGASPVRAEAHVRAAFLSQFNLNPDNLESRGAAAWRDPAARERYRHVFSPLVMRGVLYMQRLCAALSIDLADPWNDRRIAEFVLASPQHRITGAREQKRLSRMAMRGIMPEAAIAAARKVVPEPLYLDALRRSSYETVMELMTDSLAGRYGFIDEVALRERFGRFVAGSIPYFDLWSTLSLEFWLRCYWR